MYTIDKQEQNDRREKKHEQKNKNIWLKQACSVPDGIFVIFH